MNYRIGSIIEYRPFGGGLRRVRVTDREANGKNGHPTFDGVMVLAASGPEYEETDSPVWGYDDQIERVVKF